MASTSMAMALVLSIWIFFRATGAAFNPNIALTLVLLKVITPTRFVLFCLAQLLGAMAAAGVLEGLLPGGLNVNCAPSNGIGIAQVRPEACDPFRKLTGTSGYVLRDVPHIRPVHGRRYGRSRKEQVDALRSGCHWICTLCYTAGRHPVYAVTLSVTVSIG